MSLLNDIAEVQDGYIRSTALRLLLALPEYRANDIAITDAVRAIGLGCTNDQMRGHLTWFQEQRLVMLTELDGLLVATLTERGADAAAGRIAVPGVQRPKPGR